MTYELGITLVEKVVNNEHQPYHFSISLPLPSISPYSWKLWCFANFLFRNGRNMKFLNMSSFSRFSHLAANRQLIFMMCLDHLSILNFFTGMKHSVSHHDIHNVWLAFVASILLSSLTSLSQTFFLVFSTACLI